MDKTETTLVSVNANLANAGIDPTIIIAIVAAVIELIKSCQDKQRLREHINNPGPLARFLLRRHLKRELGGEFGVDAWSQLRPHLVIERVLTAAKETTDDELEILAQL